MRRALTAASAILITGVMLVVCLPPGDFGYLGWCALFPLLIAFKGSSFGRGFLASLAACMIAAWLSVQGWLYSSAQWKSLEERMAGEAAWHYMGFLMLAVVIGTIVGIWSEAKHLSLVKAVWLACLGFALESLTALQLPVTLGLTQYRSMAMMGVASVTGLFGVSLLVWVANLLLAWGVSARLSGVRTRQTEWAWMAPVVLALLGAVTTYPLPGPKGLGTSGTTFAALQTRSFEGSELMDLSQSSQAWLTVWPELSAIAEAPGGQTGKLIGELRRRNIRIATSFEDDATPKRHNTMSVLGPAGESSRYWKRKLFGGEAQNHQPGTEPAVASVEGLTLGLNVCFDSCFPVLIRETASAGSPRPAVILLPSMGPESPNGVVQAMHGAFTPFRSAENGVAFVRGETSAAAMITDERGRIVAYAEPGYQGAIVTNLSLERRSTAYQVLGDRIWYVAVAFVVAYPFGSRWTARRVNAKRQTDG